MSSSVSNSTVFILASSSNICSSDQSDTVLRWSPIQVLTHHSVLNFQCGRHALLPLSHWSVGGNCQ